MGGDGSSWLVVDPKAERPGGQAAGPRTGARLHGGGAPALVPAVEGREVPGVPRLAQPRRAQVPVRADLARGGAQVVPEVGDRGPAPEPVAVVDAVDDQP